jgi:uncharacterized cofD-like protein
MGGGTGLPTLLRGLKYHVLDRTGLVNDRLLLQAPFISDLTAIVAVSDDGGSSGRLRRNFRMLPPGDLRNCMVALAEDEHLSRSCSAIAFVQKENLPDTASAISSSPLWPK